MMDFLSPIVDFVGAQPYAALLLVIWSILIIVNAINVVVGSRPGSSGGRSSSNHIGSIAQTGSSAKEHMYNRSDTYVQDVLDTIWRHS
jgi:hypothetical protein